MPIPWRWYVSIGLNTGKDNPLTTPGTTACTSMPRPDVSPRVGYRTQQHHSGRQTKPCAGPPLMPNNAQNNILITQDGQACLGEFGIAGAFQRFDFYTYELGTLRYIAPECLLSLESPRSPKTTRTSQEGDVYSLAMTSFSVRSAIVVHPTT